MPHALHEKPLLDLVSHGAETGPEFCEFENFKKNFKYFLLKNLCPYKQPSRLLKDCAEFLIKDHSSIPLILALDVTELIHVTEYKALLQQSKSTARSKRNKNNMPQKPKVIN